MDKRSLLKKKKANKENERYKEREQIEIDYDSQKPIFSFYNIPYGKTYCLSQCEPKDKADFAHTLLLISQKQWKDISSTDRKQLGYEHIPIKQFHAKSFPDIVTEDVNSLTVFTYSHGGRVAGIRQNDVFHIIFVGDDLYPH
jgi:hypothetical protein